MQGRTGGWEGLESYSPHDPSLHIISPCGARKARGRHSLVVDSQCMFVMAIRLFKIYSVQLRTIRHDLNPYSIVTREGIDVPLYGSVANTSLLRPVQGRRIENAYYLG
jgi:hypothetical protein